MYSEEQLEKQFLKAINTAYRNYLKHGARSTNKIKPIHRWLSDAVSDKLKAKHYVINSIRDDSSDAKEISTEGQYYPKQLDIAISYNNTLLSAIGFKFVTSNYFQNANNYFENMMGETANLRRSNIIYGNFLVIPSCIRYLKKDGSEKGRQNLTSQHIEKYRYLFIENDFPHKPDIFALIVVDINYATNVIRLNNVKNNPNFSTEIKTFLKREVNLGKFLRTFATMTKQKKKRLT